MKGIEYMHSVVKTSLNCVAEGKKEEKVEGEEKNREGEGEGEEEGEEKGKGKEKEEEGEGEGEEGRWILKETMKAMEEFLLEVLFPCFYILSLSFIHIFPSFSFSGFCHLDIALF